MKEGLDKIIASKSKVFLVFCFCFAAGSGLPTLFKINNYFIWGGYYLLCLSFSVLAVYIKNKKARFILLSLIIFILGVVRAVIFFPDCADKKNICYFNGKSAVIEGFIVAEPNRKIGGSEYVVKIEKIFFDNGPRKISGKILLKFPAYPEFYYGDSLQLHCDLVSPAGLDTGDFRYDKYLEKFGIFSACYRARAEKTGEGKGVRVLSYILNFKKILTARINGLWQEPRASLLSGILFGGRSGLPESLSENFSRTGVSHIVAVSGYNVTIIAVVISQILLFFGLYRQQAFYGAVALIIFFVVFSGLSASAVRAAVMAIAALLAKQAGREGRISNILVLTVAVMQFINPYFIFWDAGFQLSFLATLGLVYLSPVVQQKMIFMPDLIREPLVSTLAAIISTLPLILYQFGKLSLVAPLVNVLILWIMPYLMLAGAVALLASFIFFPLAPVVAAVAGAGLAYVIMIVDFFGRQSWSAIMVQIPFRGMIAMYVFIIYALVRYEKNQSS